MNRTEAKPNIVLILSDQHNASIMGCAGDSVVRTPAMDELAAGGTRLTNCYCGSPLCVPSRSALLSGVLPDRTGVFTNHHALPSDWPTFLHALVNAGYHTALVGRMHFMGPDQRHGYLERLGKDMCPTAIGGPFGDLGALQKAYGQSRRAIDLSGPGSSTTQLYDRATAELAESYLDGYGADGSSAPLFLTVGLYAPHNPYVCPPELFDYYRARVDLPVSRGDQSRLGCRDIHPAQARWYGNRDIPEVDRDGVLRARAGYYGMVELLDRRVGQVVAAARRRFGENLVIVYASDHGDMAGHLGMFWKSSMYDGSAKVPVIVNDPAGQFGLSAGRDRGGPRGGGAGGSAGRHGQGGAGGSAGPHGRGELITAPTSLLDLAATFLGLAGAQPLPVCDGVDLRAEQGEQSGERSIISLLGDLKGDAPSAMIRRGSWKLVDHAGYDEVQLFNLADDPFELVDLGADRANTQTRDALRDELRRRWDPDRVTRIVNLNARHLEVFREFVKATEPEMPEYYKPSAAENRLLRR